MIWTRPPPRAVAEGISVKGEEDWSLRDQPQEAKSEKPGGVLPANELGMMIKVKRDLEMQADSVDVTGDAHRSEDRGVRGSVKGAWAGLVLR